jgi:DNA-binding NtrC family response regulator
VRCLIAVDDARIRDTVRAAVLAFPGLEADAVDVEQGRLLLRRRRYDLAFTTLLSESRESKALWEELQAVSPRVHVVGLTPRTGLSVHRTDRSRLQLFALLGTPIDAVELFSTLKRLSDRIKRKQATPGGGGTP